MALAELIDGLQFERAGAGPLTRARVRRTYVAYASLCALGVSASVFGLPPAGQAAGLGLLFSGAGFLAGAPPII